MKKTNLIGKFALLALFVTVSASAFAQRSGAYEKFSLRTNLLYWAAATPNAGFEWRITDAIGFALDGGWNHMNWKDGDRKYYIRYGIPQLRVYPFQCRRAFIGAEYHGGSIDYKLNDTGHHGDFQGCGLNFGYKFYMTRALDLEVLLGVGYTEYDRKEYQRVNGVDVMTKPWKTEALWGPSQAGVTLVWKICK